MLTKHCELTCLVAHRSVPHVRRIHRDNEVYAIVLLENCKLCGIHRVRGCDCRDRTCTLRLERRIEAEFESRRREELRDALKILQTDRRLDFAQGYEAFHVGLEHRSLIPRTERLIDVRVDAPWCYVTYQVACRSIQTVNKKRRENASAVFLSRVLVGGRRSKNRSALFELGVGWSGRSRSGDPGMAANASKCAFSMTI